MSKNSTSVALGAVAVITVVVGAYACSASGEEEVAHCVTSDSSGDDQDYSGSSLDDTDSSLDDSSSSLDDSSSSPTYQSDYQVVDDYNCDDDDDYDSYSSYGSHNSYFWYYGGQVNSGRISGGSTTRPSNATITTGNGRTIQRGGFGGSFGGGS